MSDSKIIIRRVCITLCNGFYVFLVALFFLNYDYIWNNQYVLYNKTIVIIVSIIYTGLMIYLNYKHQQLKSKE